MQELVKCSREGAVVYLTICRPERMNALSLPTLEAFAAHVDALLPDRSARVLVVRGEGEKAFCAGADLKERRTMNDEETRRFIRTIRSTFRALELFPRPTIAMINGLALGGGCELALSCDIRIMSETATIGLTETRLAIIPGAGGTQRLARLVGPGRAKEMIFTGRRCSAADALRIGLVEQVCAPEDLADAVRAMAEAICKGGPVALEQAKFAVNRGLEVDLDTGLAIEGKAYEVLLPTEDRQEALRAFAEKRPPRFQGR